MVMTQERPTRPLRADARRNREAIVEAASDLFRTEGMAMQMDAVAQRAGLGVGTVYRHFPTKEALMVELVLHRLETTIEEAEAAMDADDAAGGIRRFIHGLAGYMKEDVGLRESIAAQGNQPVPVEECAFYREDLWDRKRALVARAQEAGVVRSDLGWADFDAVMCGLGSSILAGGNPDLMADVLLEGLRVPKACEAA